MENILKSVCDAYPQNDYQRLLETLVDLHRKGLKKEEIESFILENYYRPFKEEFEKTYDKNVKAFADYPYIYCREFPEFSRLTHFFLPTMRTRETKNSNFLIFSKDTSSFLPPVEIDDKMNSIAGQIQKNSIFLVNGSFDIPGISLILEKTSSEPFILTKKTPEILYYNSFELFACYLQIVDFTDLLQCGRLVFIFGREQLERYMMGHQSRPSQYCISSPGAVDLEINKAVGAINEKRLRLHNDTLSQLEDHYKLLTPADISQKINEGKAKIGIVTSRFTTAVQYYLRDCAVALEKLGYETRTLIEETDISSMSDFTYVKFLNEFRPDITLVIDHFRWSIPHVPVNMAFVCWLQDFLPTLISKESASKVGKLDFVLNQYGHFKDFKELGYPEEQQISGVISVNPDIYRIHELTEDEKQKYSADICFISNSGNIEESFEDFIKLYDSHPSYDLLRSTFQKIKNIIYDDIYQERAHYYDLDSIFKIVSREFKKVGLGSMAGEFHKVIYDFKVNVVGSIHKVVPLLWLAKKGYDMKLWGRPWSCHPTLKKYAMGIAPNGVVMSKILNASKIALGVSPAITFHPRLMETLLSGCLYIGQSLPQNQDWSDARNFLDEGEEFLLYYGKKDLFDKVDHYLANDIERKKIVEKGSEKIRTKYSYETLMKNMLDAIARRLAGQRYKN